MEMKISTNLFGWPVVRRASVLECGSPLPLFLRPPQALTPSIASRNPTRPSKSASRRRAEAALWRAAQAGRLAHSKTSRLIATLAASCITVTQSLAATIYDSAGFESPRFVASQPVDGQDPSPVGPGPWQQDNGASTAIVSSANPIEGAQSLLVTRTNTANGNTRWGVVKSIAPGAFTNVVEILFDMRVTYAAQGYGPLFGIEAYDASAESPKLIGSLFLDASTGELICHETGTARHRATGQFLARNVHHHFKLAINFTTKTCAIYANGNLLHTEPFVDATVAAFTDAPITTLAAGSPNETGTAYFDNYRINSTTSAYGYLAWRGGGANRWDVGVSSNWFDGIDTVAFADGDAVVFDDTGAATPAMSLQGTLMPASVTVISSNDYVFAGTGTIGGAGALMKRGLGTLTLSGAHDFSGGTVVSNGTLLVENASGSATGTGAVVIASPATLAGNGNIGGPVTIASGGVLRPGNSIGTLTVSNALWMSNAVLHFQLGANSDRANVNGDLRLSGALNITDAGGFGPGTYTLFNYGGALTSGGLSLASAPSGYDYTVSTNTPGQVNLIVTLPPPVPAAPTQLAATAMSENRIDLTWTDNATNETSFLIERSINNVNFEQIASAGADVTSYSDAGLAAATRYYYRVRASNAGGQSHYSNVATAETAPSEAVAWYEFELNTLDSSGHNNHAVPLGTLLYGQGRIGPNGAAFDGTAFAEITRVIATNFTVAMWIKTTNTGTGSVWYNGMGLVDGEMVGNAADWGCSVLNSKFALGIGAPDTTVSTTANIDDGAWHHVAATRDSSSGAVKLYVDGALNTTATAPTGPRTAPNELRIGATHSAAPVFYRGEMDELRLYDRVLNPSEIRGLLRPTFRQWQQQYFGCTNCPQGLATADADGDGMSNSDEYRVGTNPTNHASALRIVSTAVQTNSFGLAWTTAAGRTNVVQASTGDTNGGFTGSFIDVSGPIYFPGEGDVKTNYVDVGGADGTARYYRVRVVE